MSNVKYLIEKKTTFNVTKDESENLFLTPLKLDMSYMSVIFIFLFAYLVFIFLFAYHAKWC